MPTIIIDGQSVTIPEGATLLEAARAAGIEIPTLCYREGLPAQTSCMVCVVRVDGAAKMVPSCATAVREGMVVESQSDEVLAARRMALELLLSDHLGDCLAPCQLACPAGMDIPRMIRAIVAGDVAAAVAIVQERIPLPTVLGRICPAPCEGACRRGSHDAPVSICLLKRWVGDEHLNAPEIWRPEMAPASGKRVVIVGAGPAGLSATAFLQRMGHHVTLVDERGAPGGALRQIPARTLPLAVLADEVATLLGADVEQRMDTRLGQDVQLDELRASFDAVLLTVGAVEEADAEQLGLPYGRRGLEADRITHESPLTGVFIAGSAQSPSRMAVRAVAGGRGAALAIDQHLRGAEIVPERRPFNVSRGRLTAEEAALMAEDASDHGRIEPSWGAYAGFNDEEATREGLRCLHCDCRALETCRLRKLSEELQADPRKYATDRRRFTCDATHPAIIYEAGKCIACGLCVEIARRYEEPLGLTFIGRGFDIRTAVPFGESLAEGLRRAAVECAEACPTGALVVREQAEEADEDEQQRDEVADGPGPDQGV